MTAAASDLTSKTCQPCKSGDSTLDDRRIRDLLAQVPGWQVAAAELSRTFSFKDYYQTIAFVNAIAWISHHQDHHPDLEVGYNKCRVRYSTHSVGGLSENDFICAAKVSALLPT